jgi:hypothetical protein
MSEKHDTDPYGMPCFTLVGDLMPPRRPAGSTAANAQHPRPPARDSDLPPLGQAVSKYLDKHPPVLDDAIVLDIDLHLGGPGRAWARIKTSK